MLTIHIEIFLKTDEQNMELPLHYNQVVQGAIYNSIDKELAAFLHDKGYMVNNRSFKMFTFSKLFGNYLVDKEKKNIIFKDEIKLVISSPLEEFCQSLANIILIKGYMILGQNKLEVQKIIVKKSEVKEDKIRFVTLSPIVTYSTLLRPDGRKYTCYFQPGEPDFERILIENLAKKYRAIHQKEIEDTKVKIKVLNKSKLAVIKYKNTIIKGYSGKFEIQGPRELLQVGVDSGLGSKNSQGFGCVKLLDGRRKEVS